MPDDDLNEQAARVLAQSQRIQERTSRRYQALEWAQQQVSTAMGTAVSDDGLVRATVDETGMLTHLELAPSTKQARPEDLANAITTVVQRAVADSRAKIRDVYVSLQNENVITDLPSNLPSPPTVGNVSLPLPPTSSRDEPAANPTPNPRTDTATDPWQATPPRSRPRSDDEDDEGPPSSWLNRQAW